MGTSGHLGSGDRDLSSPGDRGMGTWGLGMGIWGHLRIGGRGPQLTWGLGTGTWGHLESEDQDPSSGMEIRDACHPAWLPPLVGSACTTPPARYHPTTRRGATVPPASGLHASLDKAPRPSPLLVRPLQGLPFAWAQRAPPCCPHTKASNKTPDPHQVARCRAGCGLRASSKRDPWRPRGWCTETAPVWSRGGPVAALSSS